MRPKYAAAYDNGGNAWRAKKADYNRTIDDHDHDTSLACRAEIVTEVLARSPVGLRITSHGIPIVGGDARFLYAVLGPAAV